VAGFLDTQSSANQTEALYIAYFGRAADGPGYLYWTTSLASGAAGLSIIQVANSFAVQPEAKGQYSFLASPPTVLNANDPVQVAGVTSFVQSVYQHLFSHAADSTGLTYWVNAILTGGVSVGSAVYAIGNGATGNDQTIITQKIAAADSFTAQTYAANITSGAQFIAAAQNSVAPVINAATETASVAATTAFVNGTSTTSLTLTPGQDTFSVSTAGAVFIAPLVTTSTQINAGSFNVQTLSTNDSLTDSVGDGTLNAQLNAAGQVANVTMTGIKTANLVNTSAAAAGFEGTVTGLTAVNVTNSSGGIALGAVGAGLATPLTNVAVTGFFGLNGSTLFNGIIAAKAGAAANTINVSLSGLLGGTGAADLLIFSTDGAAGTKASPNTSYGTWAITSSSNADLQLMQNGVGGATTLTLAGAGNLALGQDAAGNWQNLATINASTDTGNVTITGFATTIASNVTTAANPAGLFGSVAGLLNGNTALTSYSLSSGTNILDVSSFKIANMTALTTTPGTAVATNNEIIVTSLVADTIATTTFANIKGFEILGIVGAGGDTGVINLANLPTTINDIFFQTLAAPASLLQINTLPTAFTVDTENNGNTAAIAVGGIGPAAGLTDSLTLILGQAGQTVLNDAVGAFTVTGDELINITSQGGPTGAVNTLGVISLSPSLTGNEVVTISGAEGLTIGTIGTGSIADFTSSAATALNTNNLTLTITDTGIVTLNSQVPGGGLLSTLPVGDTAGAGVPGNSTNAVTIDAHLSGGLIMLGGDANFTIGASAAASTGDTITGSATASNLLGGSIGNDTITGTTNLTASDSIYTGGGTDKITLAAGHTAADHVELYAGVGLSTGSLAAGTLVETAVAGSITFGAGDTPQLGWWNLGTGQTAVSSAATNAGSALGLGFSTDMSTVTNFVPGTAAHPQDVIDLSVGAWGGSGVVSLATSLAVVGSGPGTAASFTNAVAAGGAVTSATGSVLLLATAFSNAAGLATGLASAGGAIHFTTPLAAGNYHIIVAYQDLNSPADVRIADLNLHTTAASSSTLGSGTEFVAVSDMVQLTGVSLSQLNAANIHFVS
jgi:hypothetical protein